MGISQNFMLIPVHAHVMLLGWASLGIAGVIYHLYPAAAATRLARWHFWLHNLGLPVFMVALGLLLAGTQAALPAVGLGATVVVLGLVLFAVNVFINIKPAS
jgi:cbb3-type cytochrome oxidase subunit 1